MSVQFTRHQCILLVCAVNQSVSCILTCMATASPCLAPSELNAATQYSVLSTSSLTPCSVLHLGTLCSLLCTLYSVLHTPHILYYTCTINRCHDTVHGTFLVRRQHACNLHLPDDIHPEASCPVSIGPIWYIPYLLRCVDVDTTWRFISTQASWSIWLTAVCPGLRLQNHQTSKPNGVQYGFVDHKWPIYLVPSLQLPVLQSSLGDTLSICCLAHDIGIFLHHKTRLGRDGINSPYRITSHSRFGSTSNSTSKPALIHRRFVHVQLPG